MSSWLLLPVETEHWVSFSLAFHFKHATPLEILIYTKNSPSLLPNSLYWFYKVQSYVPYHSGWFNQFTPSSFTNRILHSNIICINAESCSFTLPSNQNTSNSASNTNVDGVIARFLNCHAPFHTQTKIISLWNFHREILVWAWKFMHFGHSSLHTLSPHIIIILWYPAHFYNVMLLHSRFSVWHSQPRSQPFLAFSTQNSLPFCSILIIVVDLN